MKERPLRTTVVGSYPFPGWLEHASSHLDDFGPDDLAELVDDAVLCAIHDQVEAGLDVITDGEQTRLDFNLSFYGYLEGIERESAPARRLGPPAHDQRARHTIVGELAAPRGLGVVEEWERLRRLAPPGPALKASVPGPYTLSGRLVPNERYPNRDAVAEALWPIVAAELEALVAAGCGEITVDEPSMSCTRTGRTRRAWSISSTGRLPRSAAARGCRRTSASGTTRDARWARGATRRCFRLS